MGLVLVLSAVVLLGFVAVVLHLRALGRDVRALAAAVQDQGHDRRPEHASTVLPPVPPPALAPVFVAGERAPTPTPTPTPPAPASRVPKVARPHARR